MSTELTVLPPAELFDRGKQVADACREIVLKTVCDIQGKRYVQVEGWQAIAATFGTTPEIVEDGVKVMQDGVMAEVVLKRDSDGYIMSRAYGWVGFDEDPSAAKYAVIGKAQTRAVSRVCRHKFAFVVVLIDSTLSTTPYEEVPKGGFKDRQKQLANSTGTQIKGILKSYSSAKGFFGGWVNDTYVFTKERGLGEQMAKLENKLADLTVVSDGTTKTGRPKAVVKAVFSGVAEDPDQPPTAQASDLQDYPDEEDDIPL